MFEMQFQSRHGETLMFYTVFYELFKSETDDIFS